MITDTAVINPGTNPTLNVTVQNVSCFGANDGMIITSTTSGTLHISFLLMVVIHLFQGTPFGPSGKALILLQL